MANAVANTDSSFAIVAFLDTYDGNFRNQFFGCSLFDQATFSQPFHAVHVPVSSNTILHPSRPTRSRQRHSKGTLCAHLQDKHSLARYSVGDGLRDWMRHHKGESLAAAIQDKLDNQGFLDSEDLDPFIHDAIQAALLMRKKGILIDGYPRCLEQQQSLDTNPFEDLLPHSQSVLDIVLAFRVSKEKAQARYVGRTRDQRDTLEKFEKRFAEYEAETTPVEVIYRDRGTLVEIDANGTKEENVAELERQLGLSPRWQDLDLG